jgi:hypothetical protein
MAHHLGQVADAEILWLGNGSRSGGLCPSDNLQQSTFAGTVLAHKCYPVALVYDETDIVEQVGPAEIDAYVVY